MYLDHLELIAKNDIACLLKAEKSYGDSWKKRGGIGAFMMLARKWDRLENVLKPVPDEVIMEVPAWDIFLAAENDSRPEGIIDDIRDLRRYLMLVEAELIARKEVKATGK